VGQLHRISRRADRVIDVTGCSGYSLRDPVRYLPGVLGLVRRLAARILPVDDQPTVFIVDDDRASRRSLSAMVESLRLPVETFASVADFLDAFDFSRPGCVLLDVRMPGMVGPELLDRLAEAEIAPPVIFISAVGDVATVVRVMKAGALDFLEKPCPEQQLREALDEGLRKDADNRQCGARATRIRRRIAQLAPGERDVLKMLVQGESNRTTATLLGLSVRAVEVRRAKLMRKMKAKSLAELVRLTLTAGNSLPATRPAAAKGR
jgi:two-component system response regulator FixJ